jgi:uncharacterized membrane protein (UPF0182 family)
MAFLGLSMGFGSILGVIALLLAIWVIYDVLVNNKGLSTGMKVLWIVLALILGGIIPAIIYYFVYKN